MSNRFDDNTKRPNVRSFTPQECEFMRVSGYSIAVNAESGSKQLGNILITVSKIQGNNPATMVKYLVSDNSDEAYSTEIPLHHLRKEDTKILGLYGLGTGNIRSVIQARPLSNGNTYSLEDKKTKEEPKVEKAPEPIIAQAPIESTPKKEIVGSIREATDSIIGNTLSGGMLERIHPTQQQATPKQQSKPSNGSSPNSDTLLKGIGDNVIGGMMWLMFLKEASKILKDIPNQESIVKECLLLLPTDKQDALKALWSQYSKHLIKGK